MVKHKAHLKCSEATHLQNVDPLSYPSGGPLKLSM